MKGVVNAHSRILSAVAANPSLTYDGAVAMHLNEAVAKLRNNEEQLQWKNVWIPDSDTIGYIIIPCWVISHIASDSWYWGTIHAYAISVGIRQIDLQDEKKELQTTIAELNALKQKD